MLELENKRTFGMQDDKGGVVWGAIAYDSFAFGVDLVSSVVDFHNLAGS